MLGLFDILDRLKGRESGFNSPFWPIVLLALFVIPQVMAVPFVTRSLSPLYVARRMIPVVIPVLLALGAGAAAPRLEGLFQGHSRAKRSFGADASGAELAGGAPYLQQSTRMQGLAAIVIILLTLSTVARNGKTAYAIRDFGGTMHVLETLVADSGVDDVYLFEGILAGSRAGRLARGLREYLRSAQFYPIPATACQSIARSGEDHRPRCLVDELSSFLGKPDF